MFLFQLVLMSLLSIIYEIDVCVELLADNLWEAQDDKTHFFIVGVDISDKIFLKMTNSVAHGAK